MTEQVYQYVTEKVHQYRPQPDNELVISTQPHIVYLFDCDSQTYTKEVRDKFGNVLEKKARLPLDVVESVIKQQWPEHYPLPDVFRVLPNNPNRYTLADILAVDSNLCDMMALWQIEGSHPILKAIRRVIPRTEPF